MRQDREAEFAEFVRTHRPALLGYAILLCGDRHLAEDVVQVGLIRVYRRWDRVRAGTPAAYARRAVAITAIDHTRRPFVGREVGVAVVPETATPDADTTLDPQLVAALQELPPRMRAVVVLRYVEDLAADQVAAILGCRPGTVKSQAARDLAKLSNALAPPPTTSSLPLIATN
jgi:RNA polymerase sigma-70 factor (sigma-E family)